MSSLSGILSTARMAMYAHQTAIQTTSHNISNAETPGYSRQRAQFTEGPTQRLPYGNLGTGVRIADIGQVRDALLDASFRRESSAAQGFGQRRDLLQQLEGIFAEPGATGFATTLDQFWNSWSDLANNPTSSTAREVVRQRGEQVAMSMNVYVTRLDELTSDTTSRLGASLAELNGLTREVAEINTRIVAAEASGTTAGDLRDQRNLAIDRIARIVPVQVIPRANGSLGVTINGESIVDGDLAKPLVMLGGPPNARIAFEGSTQPLQSVGGQLGGLLQVLNSDVPAARARLDELASSIVAEVNAQHRTGWSAGAEPVTPPATAPPGWAGSNVDFFDAASLSAGTMRLSDAVRASRDNIAAGRVYGGTGDNTVALDLGGLRDRAVPVGSASLALGVHFRETITGIGREVQAAAASATVYETLATQAEIRRQSVSGVSTDEELIALMRHQQAYVAATRIVSAVDEMTQALLGMV